MTSASDTIFVLCENCGSEGRLYRTIWHPYAEPEEVDDGECSWCHGTGFEEVECAPIDEEDLDDMVEGFTLVADEMELQ